MLQLGPDCAGNDVMEQEEEECNATVDTQTLELPLSAGQEETPVYK